MIFMKTLFLALAALAFIASPMAAHAAPEIGKPAPEFTGTDSNGNVHKLSDFKGKTVVLEWTNPQCPFVVKHYESGNMQKLQAEYTAKDVVWLSINSSAAGKEGNQSAEEANTYMMIKNPPPRHAFSTPRGRSVNSMARKLRRICSSSTRKASSFMKGPLMTMTATNKKISLLPKIT